MMDANLTKIVVSKNNEESKFCRIFSDIENLDLKFKGLIVL